jgi:hypothetical protein
MDPPGPRHEDAAANRAIVRTLFPETLFFPAETRAEKESRLETARASPEEQSAAALDPDSDDFGPGTFTAAEFSYLGRPWETYTGRWHAVLSTLLTHFLRKEAFTALDLGSGSGYFSLQLGLKFRRATVISVEGSTGFGNGSLGLPGGNFERRDRLSKDDPTGGGALRGWRTEGLPVVSLRAVRAGAEPAGSGWAGQLPEHGFFPPTELSEETKRARKVLETAQVRTHWGHCRRLQLRNTLLVPYAIDVSDLEMLLESGFRADCMLSLSVLAHLDACSKRIIVGRGWTRTFGSLYILSLVLRLARVHLIELPAPVGGRPPLPYQFSWLFKDPRFAGPQLILSAAAEAAGLKVELRRAWADEQWFGPREIWAVEVLETAELRTVGEGLGLGRARNRRPSVARASSGATTGVSPPRTGQGGAVGTGAFGANNAAPGPRIRAGFVDGEASEVLRAADRYLNTFATMKLGAAPAALPISRLLADEEEAESARRHWDADGGDVAGRASGTETAEEAARRRMREVRALRQFMAKSAAIDRTLRPEESPLTRGLPGWIADV